MTSDDNNNNARGRTWIFEQSSAAGHGFWYEAGPGRIDEEGRGLGSVGKVAFRNFTGDILVCPPGKVPPGHRSPPSFPLPRYSSKIEDYGETPLGLTWGFRHIHPKSGKGYPDRIGVGWFDEEGRARGRFYLRLVSGFKGIVIICPPRLEPPPGPFAPSVILNPKAGTDEHGDEGDPDAESEL
jgi:hypothetical protein